MTKAREPGAEQAVADLQAVIEEAERPIGGERRQPERQPRQLHGHGIQVDAVQAALGDRAADGRRARARSEIARMAAARSNERRFVGGGEIAAGGDQKRAAAHRRVDDSKLQDAFGRGVADERSERPADKVVGDRLRRVERAGRFADARSARRSSADAAVAVWR